jgi:BirA family biotin operon repressor/biotin-[acetyl-CoA-carboxylase] ligase
LNLPSAIQLLRCKKRSSERIKIISQPGNLVNKKIWYYLSVTRALSPSSIKRSLKTSLIGRELLYFTTLASTMDTARQVARQKTADGTVIIAGQQTAGRGRLKHSWLSPAGSIALSIVLYPDIAGLPYLIMIASLAVVRSIEAVAGMKTQIKWPNDVLIDGKKVCGILV